MTSQTLKTKALSRIKPKLKNAELLLPDAGSSLTQRNRFRTSRQTHSTPSW